MKRHHGLTVLGVLAMVLALAPAYAGEPSGDVAVGTSVGIDEGFVPVAIWELKRDGFPTIRHAWVAGSEKMLRVSWDDGITWFGFRPVYTDKVRGLLSLKLVLREELGRGEVAWRDKAGMTVTTGVKAVATLPATALSPAFDVTLTLVDVKEVSPSELKETKTVASQAARQTASEAPPTMMNSGGPDSCCVSCQGMRVCDCSVCIVECHLSCCLGGCFCQSC